MEQHAKLIAAEILKFDPNFIKDMDSRVKEEFEEESESLNMGQHEKPDFKDMN